MAAPDRGFVEDQRRRRSLRFGSSRPRAVATRTGPRVTIQGIKLWRILVLECCLIFDTSCIRWYELPR
jgi:hypothetical protein